MTDLLELRPCKDLKITIGPNSAKVIIDGYPIEYKKPEGENDEECRRIMIGKMLEDVLPLIYNCQLNTFSARFDDYLSNRILHDVFEERSSPLKAHTLICKGFDFTHWFLTSGLVIRDSARVREYHELEKYADDIVKVKLRRGECTGAMPDIWETFTATDTIKYFREGQEDIYVDKPELLPPKKQEPKQQNF